MSEKPDECECCHYPAKLKKYQQGPPKREDKWLCELCAGSMAGVMYEHTTLYSHELRTLAGVICNVGNAIRAAGCRCRPLLALRNNQESVK